MFVFKQAQDNFSEALAEVKFGRNVLQETFRAVFDLFGWRTAKPGDASAQRLAVIIIPSIRLSSTSGSAATSSTDSLRVVTCSFRAFTSERMAEIAISMCRRFLL